MSPASQDFQGLSVLVTYAHPDDEGFASGGTLAMLIALGARVTLVCATNGDVGEISDAALATPETLGQVRQEELRQAIAILGIQDVRFFNYRDSGMAGTADNKHPNALIQIAPSQVVGQLVDIIRETRPDVVITHDPTGGYGHPDHQTMCHRTTEAVVRAAEPAAYPEQLAQGRQPWTVPLLYYVCFPRSAFRYMWQTMLDQGIQPPFASREIDVLGTPDEDVTTKLDVSAFVDTKIASLQCHRTQLDPNGAFARLSEEALRDIMRTEYYALVSHQVPTPTDDVLAALAAEQV